MDPLAEAVSLINRVAGSGLVARLREKEAFQRLATLGRHGTVSAAGAVARNFAAARRLLEPERLPSAPQAAGLFDLSLSEEQEMVREMTQRFAAESLRPHAADADVKCELPEGLSAEFAELGITQFAVPEALGGAASESWEVTQVLVAEDLAHGDMGIAAGLLAPVGVANALARWGSADQQSRYLPAFAGDDPPAAALAVAEPVAAFDPRRLRCRAILESGDFRLHGEKSLVPRALEAEIFLVAADLVGKGPALFIVEAGSEGVSVEPDPCMGVRAAGLGRVTFDGVRLEAGALLGEETDAVDYTEVLARSSLPWCALAVGAAQAALDYTIEYCNGRIAFGEPVSHRQSVAFMIADIAIELESVRLLTWRAAARAEQGMDFAREAYLAQVLCLEKARRIGTDAVQLLGGHGYTKEHPVERWYRDLTSIGVVHGGLLL
jgi:alkylation response protein AidB-like acyl-CoA dehydrogenase